MLSTQHNQYPYAFSSHQLGMDPNGLLSVPKLEPNSLSTPEIDKEKEKQARENHCEIERRRRVKMAAYFNELCVMVPTCNTLQRKPDKLTILRMASSHMRNLRGNHSNSMSNDCAYKPSFLTDQELKHLILEAADGFLFVSQCDTGNIIYVSDAVQAVLSYSPNDWSHRSLLDFVHPDDLEKVKDQLSTQENSSNNTTGRILDLKTGTVKKEGHPNSVRNHIGSRRSFVCRMRLGHQHNSTARQRPLVDSSSGSSTNYWSTSQPRLNRACLQPSSETSEPGHPTYSVVHVTGYTKVWPPANQQNQSNAPSMYHEMDPNTGTFHLIAIARIQMTSAPSDLVNSSNGEFVSRHDQNGLVTFVDQRVTGLLGTQPVDMLKKQLSDYMIPQDQQMFKDQLKAIYDTKQTQPVQMSVHFMNNGELSAFSTSAYAFCNPCNDAFEFIVCTHTSQQYLSEPPKQQQQMGSTTVNSMDLQTANTSFYSGVSNMHGLSGSGGGQYAGNYQHQNEAYQGQFMQQQQQQPGQHQFGQQINSGAANQNGAYGNYLSN